ncbi:MAG: hypothetical protein ABIN96_04105, partial [Rubrivivax sp.]
APIDSRRIVELVQKNRNIKLAGNDKLRIDREISAAADRAHYLRDLLKELGPPSSLTVAAPGLQNFGGARLKPGEAGSAALLGPGGSSKRQ